MDAPRPARTILGLIVVGILAAVGVYAVAAPGAEDTAVPGDDAIATTTAEPTPDAANAPSSLVLADEEGSDAAIVDAVSALGMAEFATEEQLTQALAPEIVRVLIEHGAVLEVPSDVDLSYIDHSDTEHSDVDHSDIEHSDIEQGPIGLTP